MEVTSGLAVKVFVAATVTAGALELYAIQTLKRYLGWRSLDGIRPRLAGVSAAALEPLLGSESRAYLSTRTILFPWFELAFGALVCSALYAHGVGAELARATTFFAIVLPLGMISWKAEGAAAPNVITLPGTVNGLLVALLPGAEVASLVPGAAERLQETMHVPEALTGLAVAAAGACLGFVALVLPALAYRAGMGMGVVKTAMLIGAFVGPTRVVLVLMLAFFAGAVVSLVLVVRGRSRSSGLPFVPFLVGAGVLVAVLPEASGSLLEQLYGIRS